MATGRLSNHSILRFWGRHLLLHVPALGAYKGSHVGVRLARPHSHLVNHKWRDLLTRQLDGALQPLWNVFQHQLRKCWTTAQAMQRLLLRTLEDGYKMSSNHCMIFWRWLHQLKLPSFISILFTLDIAWLMMGGVEH